MNPLFVLDSRPVLSTIIWWLRTGSSCSECGLDPAATTTSNGQERSGESQMKLGSHMTDEQQARNSASHMGNTNALGHRCSEESKARMSAVHMGHKNSPETRAKLSVALKGRPGSHPSEETRAKQSASHKGKPGQSLSPESRAKISATLRGHEVSPETRAKLSSNHMGHTPSFETREKLSAVLWKGGARVYGRKSRAKRRLLGFTPLNSWFPGCEAHHINPQDVIYMPKALHRSIYHRQRDSRGMAEMNVLALQWLAKTDRAVFDSSLVRKGNIVNIEPELSMDSEGVVQTADERGILPSIT